MATYSLNMITGVVLKDDGSIIPQDDTTQAYQDYSAWLAAGNSPTLIQTTSEPISRHITVLAFRNRFTQAEKVAMDLASIDNPLADAQARQLQAILRVIQKDLDIASYVDLDRPDTKAGVQMMEAHGIIGLGRADVILNSPVQLVERPLLYP